MEPNTSSPRNKKLLRLLSLLFATITIVWVLIIAPETLKISKNFSYDANMISVDNFYDEAQKDYHGEQYSQTVFSYKTIGKQSGSLLIKNTFDVKGLDGKQIFKTEPVYGINPKTGEHVTGAGDANRSGYLFAPRGIKKGESFTYWHVSSNTPIQMKFMDEEYLYGLKVYKYKNINKGPLDQTEFMGFLPGVPDVRGVKLASDINLWIEPTSGYLVKLEDFSTDYYFYDRKTGERIAPYNKFLNTYSEESLKKQVAIAKDKKYSTLGIYYGAPGFLVMLSILLLGLSFGYRYRLIQFIKDRKVGILVLSITLGSTFTATLLVISGIEKKQQVIFSDETQHIQQLIKNNIDIYTSTLLSGKALFSANKSVEQSEWHDFITTLNINENHPGIQGMGFSQVVNLKDKNSFIASVRKNSNTGLFNIYPEGERLLYTPIIYLEPMNERNIRAIGFDMYSENTRRTAMDFARDRGAPTASGKVTLVQEDIDKPQPGFLIYVPVYTKDKTIKTAEDKKEALIGYVYAPFRMYDFMKGVIRNDSFIVDVQIYDGLKTSPESLMYSTLQGDSIHKNITFRKVETVYIAGHPWTIEYTNTQTIEKSFWDTMSPIVTFVIGLLITFLLNLVIYIIYKSREEAVLYGKKLTKDLEQSKENLEEKNKDLEEKMLELNKLNQLMVGRELAMIELKNKLGEKS